MNNDPSSDVRKNALDGIDIDDAILDKIIEKSLDLDAKVRNAFYTTKIPQIPIEALSFEQCETIIKNGLGDELEEVRKVCLKSIVKNWARNENTVIHDILSVCNLSGTCVAAALFLQHYFSAYNPSVEINQIVTIFNTDDLSEQLLPLHIFTLRAWMQHGKTPISLPEFSFVVERLLVHLKGDSATEDFGIIAVEYLRLLQYLDHSDEFGRRECLGAAISVFVFNIEEDSFVSAAIDLIWMLVDKDSTEMMNIFSYAVQKINSICLGKDDLDDPQTGMATLAFDPKQHPKGLIRILEIYHAMLSKFNSLSKIRAHIYHYTDEVVIPAINSNYVIPQQLGLECIGLFGIWEISITRQYMPLFIDFLQGSSDELLTSVIKIYCDVNIVHRHACILSAEKRATAEATLCKTLLTATMDIQIIAAEALCKLSILGISQSQQITTSLLVMYFKMSLHKDFSRLYRILYFYVKVNGSIEEDQLTLASCIVPALDMINFHDFPKNDLVEFARSIASMTSIVLPTSKSPTPHTHLCCDILGSIKNYPTRENVMLKARILLFLDLETVPQSLYDRILSDLSKILQKVSDKEIRSIIHQCIDAVTSIDRETEPGSPIAITNIHAPLLDEDGCRNRENTEAEDIELDY